VVVEDGVQDADLQLRQVVLRVVRHIHTL
jgi:hypothetical protein